MTVINDHVTRLVRSLSWRSADQIIEERGDPEQLKSIDTVAKQRLVELVSDEDTRVVVLTGDAGHGKTHLCRTLLEYLLDDRPGDALARLKRAGAGDVVVGRIGSRDLHIVKDLSELTDAARERLRDALEASGRVTVVCGNEGKLRSVVADDRDRLDVLRRTLEESQRSGRISVEPGVFVVDLNHQSVTTRTDDGVLGGLLKQWLSGHKWRKCKNCPANAHCPILANRRMLAGEDDPALGEKRRAALELVLRIAEQSGVAITIRETQVLVALAITGNLSCNEVHAGSFDVDLTAARLHHFCQVVFDPPLTDDERDSLPLLRALARLDPGRIAIRSVDEALIANPPADWGASEGEVAVAKPTTRRQMRTEAREHRDALALLRRRDFFDLRTDGDWREMLGEAAPVVPQSERLGFRHHGEFEAVIGSNDPGELSTIKDRLLRGLEAVQDVRRGSQQMTSFSVVDPAYAIVPGTASILARQLSVRRIDVMAQREYWHDLAGDESVLPDTVDWVDRRISVVFRPQEQDPVAVSLDLVQFEFVFRAAGGLASRRFFEGDIRRITGKLDALAEGGAETEDTIKVVYEDRILSILVENERIRCEGGGA